MPHKRHTFFDDNVLAEIAGRLKFGGKPLEKIIEEIPEPEIKPWIYPPHECDDLGKHFDLMGFEFKALTDKGIKLLESDFLVQQTYKRFLQAVRLRAPEIIEKVTKHERKQALERARREDNYDAKVRAREQKIKNVTKSWQEVRDTVRTRWRRLERSLAKLLEIDAKLESMDDRDVAFIEELERRSILEIAEGRVISVNWNAYEDLSIEDINEIVKHLDDHPSGGFIKPKSA